MDRDVGRIFFRGSRERRLPARPRARSNDSRNAQRPGEQAHAVVVHHLVQRASELWRCPTARYPRTPLPVPSLTSWCRSMMRIELPGLVGDGFFGVDGRRSEQRGSRRRGAAPAPSPADRASAPAGGSLVSGAARQRSAGGAIWSATATNEAMGARRQPEPCARRVRVRPAEELGAAGRDASTYVDVVDPTTCEALMRAASQPGGSVG